VADVMWPTTSALLSRVGIPRNARCLDVGCGGGDVTLAIAKLVPDGFVIGTDYDEAKLILARDEAGAHDIGNIEFIHEDVTRPATDGRRFDLIYVRFVLTHLPDPAATLAILADRLVPGGALVVEDIDFRGHFSYPQHPAFDRYVELYTAAVQSRGCDPNIGPRLPSLLRGADLQPGGACVVQPAGIDGEVKLIAPITLEAIADAVLAAGLATHDELAETVDDLYAFAADDESFMSIPRVVQTWSRART
jgi:SAM-dependent methyltransferase